VDEAQVRRDHVISHCLAALTTIDDDRLTFFGGTALSRTRLPDLRLSEDIDLIARAPRTSTAQEIQDVLTTTLRPLIGTPIFEPAITQTRGAQASVMLLADVRVQIQLLASEGYPRWPTEVAELHQRYADAPSARMRVLTRPAAVAAKLSAWADRRAPRDLYDLWALATRGDVDADGVALFARHGPFTDARRVSFSRLPDKEAWHAALGHQGRVLVGPDEAADVVRNLIAEL
jgi:predicted nucleotidyltransferase component of viral defense system